MAVCTHDIALRDLISERLPAPAAHPGADVELLFTQVIELEDERIVLTAIRARPRTEQLDHVLGALRH